MSESNKGRKLCEEMDRVLKRWKRERVKLDSGPPGCIRLGAGDAIFHMCAPRYVLFFLRFP